MTLTFFIKKEDLTSFKKGEKVECVDLLTAQRNCGYIGIIAGLDEVEFLDGGHVKKKISRGF